MATKKKKLPQKRDKLMIIDGNALIHRSFHALPPTMTKKDGTVVNAVYGYITFLIKAMREMKPEYVVLTLDKKGPTFRHKKFKEYKAKRVKAPDELYAQIPMVKKLTQAFNIPVFEKTGFEADDLIGTIVKTVDDSVESIIVTGDKDTLQLVDESTKVYSMSRGISDSILYDKKQVKEKMGVTPEQVIDYKALRGDPSDNIPGVPGVGEKTAVNLLTAFKNLDKIYENVKENSKKLNDTVKPRIVGLLHDNKKQAYLSYDLATIKCDVPIKFDLEATRFLDLDKQKVIDILSDFEFNSLLPRVQIMFNENIKTTKEEKIEQASDKFERNKNQFKYTLVDDEKKFKAFLIELKKQKSFSFDTETSGFDLLSATLLGISFSWKKGEAYFVEIENKISKNDLQKQASLFDSPSADEICNNEWLRRMKPIFEDENVKKNAHNAKFDIRAMENNGVKVRGLNFDTMIASYLLSPGSRGHGLDALTFTELGFEKISKDNLLGTGRDKITFAEVAFDKLGLYSCEDADFTHRLLKKLKPKLKEQKLDSLFSDIEIPLISVLVAMENNGVKISKQFLAKMSELMQKKIVSLEKKIYKSAGSEFNIKSTKQLKEILFVSLEIPSDGLKKTKTGISTAADELEKLKDLHPIIRLLQEYRELIKLTSTYIDALPKLINEKSKRVHTHFNQTITATGRLSSTNPNLQNIPVRTEMGREIRKAFVASKGYSLLALDYSQIELRLAAHMSGDKKMIASFKAGADIHLSTAAEINQVSFEKVDKKMRREAKATNFGILYGQGPHGLSRTADIPYYQAKEFIDNYFLVYKDVKKYIDSTIETVRETGYAETLLGRRRYLPDINSSVVMVKRAAERMAVNTPLQGTAADMLKVAMIEVNKNVCNERVKMIMTVHDELIFEVEKNKVKEVAKKIKNIMENVIKLSVPVIVDVKAGDNWGELKELDF